MITPRIGLIGIVGELCKQDFWGTAQQVARIGYQGIEACDGYLLQGDPKENLKRFHGLGLRLMTISAGLDKLNDTDALVRKCKTLECSRVSCWWSQCDTRATVLRDAEALSRAGAALAKEGIRFCYHPHDHEFRNSFDGVRAIDILLERTDPQTVFFEMDIAWIHVGGENPSEVLKRTKGRVPAIHVKDVWGTHERGLWTCVGTGVVPIEASLKTAREVGVEEFVVEQDSLRTLDAMETALVSYLALKEMGFAPA